MQLAISDPTVGTSYDPLVHELGGITRFYILETRNRQEFCPAWVRFGGENAWVQNNRSKNRVFVDAFFELPLEQPKVLPFSWGACYAGRW